MRKLLCAPMQTIVVGNYLCHTDFTFIVSNIQNIFKKKGINIVLGMSITRDLTLTSKSSALHRNTASMSWRSLQKSE